MFLSVFCVCQQLMFFCLLYRVYVVSVCHSTVLLVNKRVHKLIYLYRSSGYDVLSIDRLHCSTQS